MRVERGVGVLRWRIERVDVECRRTKSVWQLKVLDVRVAIVDVDGLATEK